VFNCLCCYVRPPTFLIWNNVCDLVYQTPTKSYQSQIPVAFGIRGHVTTKHLPDALLGSGRCWKTNLLFRIVFRIITWAMRRSKPSNEWMRFANARKATRLLTSLHSTSGFISLLAVLIAVVLLHSACLCVCVCVCEYVFVCVLLLFFTDCRIHLFSF